MDIKFIFTRALIVVALTLLFFVAGGGVSQNQPWTWGQNTVDNYSNSPAWIANNSNIITVQQVFPFIFNGSLIIILNEKPQNNENLKAVESRVLNYQLFNI